MPRSKKQVAQVKPKTTTENPAPAPSPVPEPAKPAEVAAAVQQPVAKAAVAMSKHQKIVDEVIAGFVVAGLHPKRSDDAKFALVHVEEWGEHPHFQIGTSGGITIVELKSYPDTKLSTLLDAKKRYD